MAMITAANYQQQYPNRVVGWIDVEHSWDNDWAKAHGLDIDRVRKTEPRRLRMSATTRSSWCALACSASS